MLDHVLEKEELSLGLLQAIDTINNFAPVGTSTALLEVTTRSSPLIGDYRIADSSGAVGKDNVQQSQWPVVFKPPRSCWVILHFRPPRIGTEGPPVAGSPFWVNSSQVADTMP